LANHGAGQTFCQRVVEAASIRPGNVAMLLIESKAAETITFGSMLAQVRSIAYRLGQEQIAFGDRIAIIGENHPNWAIAYLGILYRGAVATPLDPAATQLPSIPRMRHRHRCRHRIALLLIVAPSRWKKVVRSYIVRDLLADVPSLAR
jgi:acyl-CoA synthetase (AMP-forming)/AMP-acid ligase II